MRKLIDIFSVKKSLTILLLFICAKSVFAIAESISIKPSQAILSARETSEATFQKAINDHLSGRHSDARKKYDALNGGMLASVIVLPSAVNLAALERYDEARSAFTLLRQNGNGRERDYGLLWDLWLTARTWQGGTTALQKTLADKVANYKWFSAYESAIADIYTGKGDEKSVFQLIDSIAFSHAEEKADAVTQAVFFVGGYYQYVIHQPQNAQKLYHDYASHLNKNSLERILVLKEQASLRVSQ
ncbi:hypothetical protein ABK730_24065 [Klebsiella indica]|uniref:Tetratricopeptide repeat protein n=1 Tax=Klebsiella indica TaxID=2582917 RepID=A0A5R9L9A6_9ENTR|nr:hypothetical protein [Klebsiella indica]TLV05907.1 hypothetical protein FE839_22755 [Klebsiella indica]